MKVYVVIEVCKGSRSVDCIFANKDKADKYAANENELGSDDYGYGIVQEWDVE